MKTDSLHNIFYRRCLAKQHYAYENNYDVRIKIRGVVLCHVIRIDTFESSRTSTYQPIIFNLVYIINMTTHIHLLDMIHKCNNVIIPSILHK